jgi:DNA-binding IclR family transcriptional regulator
MEYPTAHRIIKSLVANEVLRKDEATRRYHLGQLLYELGLTTEPRLDIRRYCDPMTTRLAELTGDTVFLNIRSGFDVVCVDRKEGSYPIKTFVFDIGSRRPLGIGAAGIALLIHEAPDALQEIIRRNAVRFSQYTNISARQAITLVAQARDCGYAAIGDVVFPRVRAVSVPFLVNSTAPFAAVSVAAVSTRLPTSRIPALVALIKAELDSLKST